MGLGAGTYPACTGQEEGVRTPRTGRQSITGLTAQHRQTTTLTHLQAISSPCDLRVFGLWEEALRRNAAASWPRFATPDLLIFAMK